ncbi:MAG: Ldh family oxidoreductase [Pseudomonadota bacterium]
MVEQDVVVDVDELKSFVRNILVKIGVPNDDAMIVADNLVAADLRGIPSHGVARFERYVKGIRDGLIGPVTTLTTVVETAATATLDANDGLGQVAGKAAMELAIRKAGESGAGFVAVRHSNHYGIAAFYSMMALSRDMIGISMTNSAPLVVPTFGSEIVVGTNPLSVAAPASGERPFVLDMATSAVPRGKVEVCERQGKPLPHGWATDDEGRGTTDAALVLKNLLERRGGGLLPLGGEGELLGGHKGYGLSLMIDILTGVLSGGAFGTHLYEKKDGRPQPANVSHFFGALDIKSFRPVGEFKKSLDRYMLEIKESAKAAGQSRIYVHGEKEQEMAERLAKTGVPLHPKTAGMMRRIATEVGVQPF